MLHVIQNVIVLAGEDVQGFGRSLPFTATLPRPTPRTRQSASSVLPRILERRFGRPRPGPGSPPAWPVVLLRFGGTEFAALFRCVSPHRATKGTNEAVM